MKVTIIAIGKTEDGYLAEGINKYLSRLNHYTKSEFKIIQSIKNAASLSMETLKLKEGELILDQLNHQCFKVLLDESGQQMTSVELSKFIGTKIESGPKTLIFITGGAFGVSDNVKKMVDFTLSLSKMTLTHQMVRLILVEQLYRAYTILNGEKYHH